MPSSSFTPSSRRCFSSLFKAPSTRTAYSRSKPKRGCMRRLASSPELVNSSRPSVFRSSRPTDCHLPFCRRGKRRNTVGRFCGSSWLTTSPAGLWYAITRAGGGSTRKRTGLPFTLTWSPNWMRWPICAGSLLTEIRPSRISCSISSREPRPAWASTLCSLGASTCGASTRLVGCAATSVSSSSKRPDTTSSKRSAFTATAASTGPDATTSSAPGAALSPDSGWFMLASPARGRPLRRQVMGG